MVVNIADYLKIHGKKPRGRGFWMFEFSSPGKGLDFDLWTYDRNATYSEAKAAAITEAKKQGWTQVSVCP